jgi:hypothetical protein
MSSWPDLIGYDLYGGHGLLTAVFREGGSMPCGVTRT